MICYGAKSYISFALTHGLSLHRSTETDANVLDNMLLMVFMRAHFIHCGPVMPYGDIDLCQHWLR